MIRQVFGAAFIAAAVIVPLSASAQGKSRPESVSIPRFRIPVNITRGA